MKKDSGRCQVKRCRREGNHINYYGRMICEHHWELHCRDKGRFDLKKVFGIKEDKAFSIS